LQEIVGKQPILVHSLHYSPIKNRIMMQISKPAKLLNQVRYLAFVPVVLALTFLFACQEKQQVQSQIPENSEYIFLNAEQLEPLGIWLSEEGLNYANFNPMWQEHGERFSALILLSKGSQATVSSILQHPENIDVWLERGRTFEQGNALGITRFTTHDFFPRLVEVPIGHFGHDRRDRGSEQLVPIAICMANAGVAGRTDTMIFWFIPTESLQNALPKGVDMMNWLRYPPAREDVVQRVDTLFEWHGESVQQLHRSARRYDFDSVLMISSQGIFFYTRSNDYLLRWPYSISEWRGSIRMSHQQDGGENLLSVREVMLMAGGTIEDADWWEERIADGRRQALARREVRRQTAYAEREFLSTMSDEDAVDVTWEIAQTMAPPRSATGDLVPYSTVAVTPEFPGGIDALHDFLRDNLVFPEEAREQGIQGTVFVSFIVEQRGRISNVELVRGIGGGADEEAIRVVSMMPNWTPGEHHGRPVRVQFNMPIRFAFMGETPQG